MTHFETIIKTLLCFLLISLSGHAQDDTVQNWPKDIVSGDFTISLYQPENVTYIDNKLTSNLAFSLKKQGQEPLFGMLWTTSLLDVDRTSRQASLASVTIDEIRLPDEVSEENKVKFQNLINTEFPKWNIEFSLDELIASLEEVSVTTSQLNNEPPKIIFANEPTALILVDGAPKFKEVEKGYELVENTGAFIIKNLKSNEFYLKGGDLWYHSNAVTGPYDSVEKVPSKIKKIAKKAEPEKKDDENPEEEYTGVAPKILIVTEPSELIVFDGEPKFSPIQNTNLLFVENTESNIFMNITSQTYFVLLSGRWFTTKNIKGDWTYLAADKLPEDFKNIPSDSKKSNVLSNVPGTKEAKDAVYDAQIPQTAAVQKDTQATEVVYNGTPEFKNIEGLKLEYAVNTESSVFKDKNNYFLCDNAVWFKASTPNGPWTVSEDRPKDIEMIPATNPQYNTKYVYIYETSPTVVYVGYTPGYYGTYVYGSTVVYGTGFYYNPWYGGVYYHHHYSYGYSVRYSPYYGWSFGFSYGSPYFWYGHSYWGHGYHHYGPPYYRPPYYRGGGRYARPSHPIYTGRRGISHYNRPVTRPSTGSNRPTTRPSTGANRPSTKPTTKPSTGINRPSTTPNKRPSYTPSTRPSTRPSSPPSLPVARPNNRPTARPSGGMNRGRRN